MKILDILTEGGKFEESVEEIKPSEKVMMNAARIKKLKAELKLMPTNPQTEKEYQMIDELRAEIERLERQ